MIAPQKDRRSAGRSFFTAVLVLSGIAALSLLNHRRGNVVPSHQPSGGAVLLRRDEEVR